MMSKLNKVLSLGLLGTAIALTSPVLVQAQEVINPDTLTTLKKRQNLQLKTFTEPQFHRFGNPNPGYRITANQSESNH